MRLSFLACATTIALAPIAAKAAPAPTVIGNIPTPSAGLTQQFGALYYETTYGNAPYADGSIYRFDPPTTPGAAWTSNLLYSSRGASGAADGAAPDALLTPDHHGNLYGTTYGGGIATGCDPGLESGCGTIFKLSPPAPGQYVQCPTCWYEQQLVQLPPALQHPRASVLIDKQGNLYTVAGNSVVEVSPPASGATAWTLTVIFSGDNGYYTDLDLGIDASGLLYGSASPVSGTSGPFIYQLSPPATSGASWSTQTLASFSTGTPLDTISVLAGGTLYIATGADTAAPSGAQCKSPNCSIFQIHRPTQGQSQPAPQLLHSFAHDPAGAPTGPLTVAADGTIYGTLATSGKNPTSAIYKLVPPIVPSTQWTETLLYNAATSPTALLVAGPLIVTQRGTLFGTASTSNNLSAFKLKQQPQ